MRTGNTAIRSWGCALTSTAMVFNYYGVDTDPGRLNQCAGDQADQLYWEPVRPAAPPTRFPPPRAGAARRPGPTWRRRWPAGGRSIVGLQGGPAGSHFLVVTAGAGDQAGNYRIVDSWDGSTYKTLADYINPKKGYLLKWLVVFEGAPPPVRRRPPPRRAAGAIAFLSPADGGVYNAPQLVRYPIDAPAGARPRWTTQPVPDGAHRSATRARTPSPSPCDAGRAGGAPAAQLPDRPDAAAGRARPGSRCQRPPVGLVITPRRRDGRRRPRRTIGSTTARGGRSAPARPSASAWT